VVRALARQGYRIRVAVRRPDLAGHLQPLGTVGQIMAVQANVRYPASLAAAAAGADTVINLTGILSNSGAQRFEAVHGFGAEASARAAKAVGARQFIQMSAIGADAASTSAYARSKADGEARAVAQFAGTTIIRPSIVFGPEDDFFNRFAAMARFAPALPLIGGGRTRFQPVYAGDVGEAIARIVSGSAAPGRVYELGGPQILTFRSLLEFILKTVDRKRLLLPIPFPVASLMGSVMEFLPGAPLTADQVELLKSDNVVSAAAEAEGRTLSSLGIAAQGIEAIVPAYLYRYRKAGQFSTPVNK
jgi:NADH dehydrogenase